MILRTIAATLLGCLIASIVHAQTPTSLSNLIINAPDAVPLSGNELVPVIKNNSLQHVTWSELINAPSDKLTVGDPTGSGYLPDNPALPVVGLVSARGASNALIGQVVNDVDYATNPFLAAGTTGYGQVPVGVASVAFGLYGLGELFNTHGVVVGGEVTARNFSGAPASNGRPPPTSLPGSFAVADGFHISCGSQTLGEDDCSTGLLVTNESGGSNVSDPSFANGIFVNGYREFGLYIADGYPTGTQNGAQINNNGNGLNLVLQTTGTMTTGNAVLLIADKDANPMAAIRQNGDGLFNNVILSNSVYLTPSSSFVALFSEGMGLLDIAPDAGWTAVKIGNGTASIWLKTPYTNTPCTNAGFMTVKDDVGTNRKVQICS